VVTLAAVPSRNGRFTMEPRATIAAVFRIETLSQRCFEMKRRRPEITLVTGVRPWHRICASA
jgi:hypothetical protein